MDSPYVLMRLLLLLFSLLAAAADDSAVMTKFAAGLSPPPKGWTGTDYCSWTGIKCDTTTNRVTSINLDSQSLSGSLPSDLNQLSQLTTLALQKNSLSGPLPSLANLSSLQEVYLDGNSFTSIPSDFFVGLTALREISISDNALAPWSIPDAMAQCGSLVTFTASNASITGTIPDIFTSFPSLQSLRLSYNNLAGSLPPSFADSEIANLWLNNQILKSLSGTIEVLSSMNQLSQVWLQANNFTGPIPDLSNCTNLFDLQLRDNQFTGIVPPSLMNLPNLSNVTLQNNKLQGPFPVFRSTVQSTVNPINSFCRSSAGPCDPQVTALLEVAGALGYPITLAQSWTGNNACPNWSFISCDSQQKNVIIVSLGNRKFSGTISPAFANLTSLRSLLLNNNSLTGTIPQILTNLPQLQTIDVANNNLSGPIPVFPTSVKFNHDGNPFLGTNITTGSGETPGSGSNTSSTSQAGSGKPSASAGMIAGIVIAVTLFVMVVLFVSYKCYIKKRHQRFGRVEGSEMEKSVTASSINGHVIGGGAGRGTIELQSQSSGEHNEMMVVEGGSVTISIQVLRQVTNNFSEENVLGRGGFGVVYKGELHDGTQIAVKRMESSGGISSKGMNEFQAEIAVLTKVRHRHLVALLGYCINGNERLLVYEYMPQGTLSQHLFEWRIHGYHHNPLTWKQRVTIALDVARGVEYLHSLAQQSFIHRDLKPSNILLGDDMRAKVADFGLVKNAPDGKYSMETRLAGTFGYLAPEYAATGRVTTKVDVYAFGVVLMEIITGRKALDENMPDERCHLVTWFRRVLISKENIKKVIDETLLVGLTDNNMEEETHESICKVAELAGYCTAREPYQRPDMGHAVNVLGPLVEQWKPSGGGQEQDQDSYGIDLHMSLPQALRRWQADEGTSTMFGAGDMSSSSTTTFGHSHSHSQSSIPSKPSGFADTFSSMDCR